MNLPIKKMKKDEPNVPQEEQKKDELYGFFPLRILLL